MEIITETMNSWPWNQRQQQQNLWMGTNLNQHRPQQMPRFGNNFQSTPILGFHPYRHVLHARGPAPRHSHQRFPYGLSTGLPIQQSLPRLLHQKNFQLQNGLLATPSQPQQQNALSSPTQQTSYKVEEIRVARKSLSTYFDQIPERLKLWQPLPQDNQVNLWEGEAGMMDHCIRPFPMPAQGEVKSSAAVWIPEEEASGSGQAPSSQTGVNNEDPPQDVVSVSDEEDSDIQVVTSNPASEVSNDMSRVIRVEDSPLTPKVKKKKKKKKGKKTAPVQV